MWEKSVPSHKVIQKEEKFENKIKKILLSEQPSGLLLYKGTHRKLVKESQEGGLISHLRVDKTLEILKKKIMYYSLKKSCENLPKTIEK